jgi:dolichol-phosphate mannosyltransferase
MANSEQDHAVTFSFVAPVFNEAESLPSFYHQLCETADALGQPYEIIFVNDGSTDNSLEVIQSLRSTDERVRYVDLSRNFGQQEALTAGYDYASGQAVITLDADGQHPPRLIEELVARWRQGYEVVYTIRTNSRDVSALKRRTSRVFYRLFEALSGLDVADQADFRLLDRKVVEAIRRMREKGRFLRGLVGWMGFRQVAVPYEAARRVGGKSGYSMGKMLRLAGAGIFNFSHFPVRAIALVGGSMILMALAYAMLALVLWALGLGSLAANLVMVLVGLTGLNLAALGVVGEYVARTYEEAKNRPIYIAREAAGFPVETKAKRQAPAAAAPVATVATEAAGEEEIPAPAQQARDGGGGEPPARIRLFT